LVPNRKSIGVLVFLLSSTVLAVSAAESTHRVGSVMDVSPVWSGHPVGFCLLTAPPWQFAAFYDEQRRMRVAWRDLSHDLWHSVEMPETLGWDSHNYVTMALDDRDRLHLAGNMHCVPLVYYRTTQPFRPDTFQRIRPMVGPLETRCTYPRFFRGPANEFLFTYRHGSSGNGDQIYNVYLNETGSWKRLLDQPLTSGEGKMNAYLCGPSKGPDGYYHLAWVWRDHPGCESNHDLSYARSRDLVHWEKSTGKPLTLPITFDSAEIVDPVPPGGGIINGNVRIGFDDTERVILSYHKYDREGYTQIYNARREKQGWVIYQTSQWDYRWAFSGGGSIPFEIRGGSVSPEGKQRLKQSYTHPKEGSNTWLLDPVTLKPVGTLERKPTRPKELSRPRSAFPHMHVKWCGDGGRSPSKDTFYQLRWETLGPHRDRPRDGEVPPPSMLELYCFKKR